MEFGDDLIRRALEGRTVGVELVNCVKGLVDRVGVEVVQVERVGSEGVLEGGGEESLRLHGFGTGVDMQG